MKFLLLALGALTLSACQGHPVIDVGANPGDPSATVPPAQYSPVTTGTRNYQPVDPSPWAETNEGVAPKKEIE